MRLQTIFKSAGIAWISLVLIIFSSWLTHVIVSIKAAAWLFLIAGAIFFPIGIVHGIATWFGADWV